MDPVDRGHRLDMAQAHVLPEDAERVRLPFEVSSVTAARGAITDVLVEHGVRQRVVDDANMVVGELVMNAIRHGRPRRDDTIEVAWWLARDALRFSVCDGGHIDHLDARMPSPRAFGGRGLAIVEQLTRWWGHDDTQGTRVTADIPTTD